MRHISFFLLVTLFAGCATLSERPAPPADESGVRNLVEQGRDR